MTWDRASARADSELADPDTPSGVVAPSRVALHVTDHFDLMMVDMNVSGARLFIKPITRPDALAILAATPHEMFAQKSFDSGLMESELGVTLARPRISPGTRLLVMHKVTYRDIRWFVLTYESDGDGVIE